MWTTVQVYKFKLLKPKRTEGITETKQQSSVELEQAHLYTI
jgi:hypothetical protein